MKCAWQAFINVLPIWMRNKVDKQGRDTLQELRLRLNSPPQLILSNGIITLEKIITSDDLHFCINVASKYSPWSASTMSHFYITAPGGHRIGICGSVVSGNGCVSGIHKPTSLCIRIARDFPGLAERASKYSGSVLIIGAPGCGKTTLLRDLIRMVSNKNEGAITVIDEKEELFPHTSEGICFDTGKNTDILSGCTKSFGIDSALRNMGPSTIAMDEITAKADCDALIHAGWCGVRLLATAHAGNRKDLFTRPVYRPLVESGLFEWLVVIQKDKSYTIERMCP